MATPKRTIRFAVGSPTELRSPVYSVWAHDARVPGASRSDVYLAARSLGGALKVSLHQDGNWQWSLTSEFVSRRPSLPGWTRPTRHAERWKRPAEFQPGYTLAFGIRFPGSELRDIPLGKLNPTMVTWLPTPPTTSFVQVSVLFSREPDWAGWPGKNSMGTQLVDRILLVNGEMLFLVHHQVQMKDELIEQLHTVKRASVQRSSALLTEPNASYRLQLFGSDEAATRIITDLAADEAAA
jgi:hypothetical protein